MTQRTLTAITLMVLLGATIGAVAQELDSAQREALIGPPAGATREGDALERITEGVSSLMRCPVCQGLSIADSPTLLAQAMKSETREMLRQGYSEDQVLTYFEESYGEFVRLEPKAQGFNLLVWIAPGAALLLGAWLVAVRVRKPKRPMPVQPDPGKAGPGENIHANGHEPQVDEYLERVRRELSS